jgi:hypothetical protein
MRIPLSQQVQMGTSARFPTARMGNGEMCRLLCDGSEARLAPSFRTLSFDMVTDDDRSSSTPDVRLFGIRGHSLSPALANWHGPQSERRAAQFERERPMLTGNPYLPLNPLIQNLFGIEKLPLVYARGSWT